MNCLQALMGQSETSFSAKAREVRTIVEQIAPILGILPVDENSPSIRQKLMLDFKIGNEEATLASY